MYLVDALGKSGMIAVATIHEAGAGFMAIGHAMLTNKLSVCLVTSGPGSTNILSAVAAAWMDSLPVLFISGQAKTETLIGTTGLRTRGVQELDIIAMVQPITKVARQVVDSEDVIFTIGYLIQECKKGRPGPCWLAIPLDIQGLEI